MKYFLKNKLQQILNTASSFFEKDELAYLVLQQKIERPVRDKVAWELQKAFDKEYGQGEVLVRCEWPSWYDEQNLDYSNSKLSARSAVDIAILMMNKSRDDYKEVLALIEFKHHAFLNTEQWPYVSFVKDVRKMQEMTKLGRKGNSSDKRIKHADMYFVMLTTSHNKSNGNVFGSAVVYQDLLTSRKGTILFADPNYAQNLMKFWEGFYDLSLQCTYTNGYKIDVTNLNKLKYNNIPAPSVPQPVIQNLGCSFNYIMHLSCMLWGPYKSSDII